MANGLEERTFRIWLAALLQSDLTNNELRKIADILQESPSMILSFVDVLRKITNGVKQDFEQKSLRKNIEIDIFEDAYSVVRDKKMSKRRLLEIMAASSQKFGVGLDSYDLSSRDLLYHFFENSSDMEKMELMRRLQGNSKDDPYLMGISKTR